MLRSCTPVEVANSRPIIPRKERRKVELSAKIDRSRIAQTLSGVSVVRWDQTRERVANLRPLKGFKVRVLN